jgi:hypothetical protein
MRPKPLASGSDSPQPSFPFHSHLVNLQAHIPQLAWAIALAALVLIPLKILSLGFVPDDDALRHVSKAVSGRAWADIMVVRPEFVMDHNPGWHWVLSLVHRCTSWQNDELLAFSIGFVFLAFMFAGAFSGLKRPEAWIAALLVAAVVRPHMFFRLSLGRPFAFSMAILVILLWWWSRSNRPGKSIGLWVGSILLFGAAAWIHGAWYLFALPVMAFGLAGQWRKSLALALCWGAGSFLGACLTGHPFGFLANAIHIALHAMDSSIPQRMLVWEVRPFDGDFNTVVAVILLMLWRAQRPGWTARAWRDPVLVLAILCYVLGFKATRFWVDWGMPALMVWMTREIADSFESHLPPNSWGRLATTMVLSVTLFFAVTSDQLGRWTNSLTREYLTPQSPGAKGWLPEDGGIIYAANMDIFYGTFFKNPQAKWRYMLGFEPTFMPENDLRIYRQIQFNSSLEAYQKWIAKMRPQDRMMLKGEFGSSGPPIPDLEWRRVSGIWIGRLPSNPLTPRND